MSETLVLPVLYVDYGSQQQTLNILGGRKITIGPSIEHLPLSLASEMIYIALIYFPLSESKVYFMVLCF